MARALIVEDDPDVRALLRRHLQKAGHTVTELATGEAALRLLRQQDFDLVLLDIILPGISGWEVARQMSSDPGLTHSSILFVSVVDRDDTPHDIHVAGWVTKPFSGKDLGQAIKDLLI